MPVKLRDALVETTDRWQDQVPAAWRGAVADVQLDAAAIGDEVMIDPWVPIFPSYGSAEILGAPKIGNKRIYHTFRALQLVPPTRVRVVVLGQDPYPDVAKATGASFEQGGLVDWVKDAHRVASSLRNILLCAAAAHTGRDEYRDPERGWTRFVDDLVARQLDIARPHELFTSYGQHGVLWLNTTLTISLFREGPNKTEVHQKAHAAFWRPLVNRLLASLVRRPKKQMVVALWGKWAEGFREPLLTEAQSAGAADRLHFVIAPHPVNETFITKKNSLADINDALSTIAEAPVVWLPPGKGVN